jgi:glycerophosphoryl diester phosphodiesterase
LADGEAQTLLIHAFDIANRRYTGTRYQYSLDPRGTAIGDFQLFDDRHGVVIERDDTQGDLNGFKVIFEIELHGAEQPVTKTLAVDLMKLSDPLQISNPGEPGDVGIGTQFAFPFVTIEDVVVLDRNIIGVLNDNNFPFSVGRHITTGQPDDTEFIIIRLEHELGTSQSAP